MHIVTIFSLSFKGRVKYNEDGNDKVARLLNRLKNTDRKLKVEKEKEKAMTYKADLAKEKVALAREKALVKFWKQQSEENENNRLEKSRKFKRNSYKARRAFPGRK